MYCRPVQTSTEFFFPDKYRCSSGPYGVDMSRPAGTPVVQTCPGVIRFLFSFRWGIGGEVILEVTEADPEVV